MKSLLLPVFAWIQVLTLQAQSFDFGDLPDSSYPTKLGQDGPRHGVSKSLFIGNAAPDSEPDGLSDANALGDDSSGADDEDGVDPASLLITAGVPHNFRIKATNANGYDAWLHLFVDWNHDKDFSDPGELEKVKVPAGSDGVTFLVAFNVPKGAVTTSPIAMRIRLGSDSVLSATGLSQDGEVEDFFIQVHAPLTLRDFGDLPDSAAGTAGGVLPDYRTLAADNGPSHGIRPGLSFFNNTGSADVDVDAETDAQPDSDGLGDDSRGDSDELGPEIQLTDVTFAPDGPTSFFLVSQTITLPIENTTGHKARVGTFIDYNSDGDFSAEESANLRFEGDGSASTAEFNWTYEVRDFAPAMSILRPIAIRARITTDDSLGPYGPATDGEVIDIMNYLQAAVPANGYDPLDLGDLPAPYPTLRAENGPRHVITPDVFLGTTAPDGELDGLPSAAAKGDDSDAAADEDSINPASLRLVPGFSSTVPVRLTNSPKAPAILTGFFDWNADGDFDDEGEVSWKDVPEGVTNIIIRLPISVPLTAVTNAPVAVRVRLAAADYPVREGPLPPKGWLGSGEVEDFLIQVMEKGFDFGDLPDSAEGTAPGTFGSATPPDYQTRQADGGPSHAMRPGLHFGNDSAGGITALDPESDGLPSDFANGDDLDGENDEGGLEFRNITRLTPEGVLLVIPGVNFFPDGIHTRFGIELEADLAVTNSTGETAKVFGFIDVNHDGDFNDPGESLPEIEIPGDDSIPSVHPRFSFLVSPTGSPVAGVAAMRFRITTDEDLESGGPASDGEVNDIVIPYQLNYPEMDFTTMMDYGDLDDGRYPTSWANNGARHVRSPQLMMGTHPTDGEADGSSSPLAQGDDDNGGPNDEDALGMEELAAYWGQPYLPPVKVTNLTGNAATLRGFADWNDDGDFLDAGESVSAGVPSGVTGLVVELPFVVPATPGAAEKVALRLRLSTDADLGPAGLAPDGEVEDHWIEMKGGWDFGDLPDLAEGTAPGVVDDLNTLSQGDYRTRLADDGPRHLIRPDLVILNDWNPDGVQVDVEPDGIPDADGFGDDYDGPEDDEESLLTAITRFTITHPTALGASVSYDLFASLAVRNETGVTAYLTGFVDGNNDGDFSDPGETETLLIPSSAGAASYHFTFTRTTTLTTHTNSWTSIIPARFRLSTASGLGPDGAAPDGEVEDHLIRMSFATDEWWRTDEDCGTTCDFFADQGTPLRLDGRSILPPFFISANDYQWNIGGTTLSGISPLLEPAALEELGTGEIPYSVSARFFPQSLGSYAGCIKIRDLDDFRQYMGAHGLMDESASPGADADGDGSSNFTEFAFGTNPTVESPAPQMIPRIVTGSGGESHLTAAYLRRAGGTTTAGAVYATPEVTYTPGAGVDLVDWTAPVTSAEPFTDLPPPPTDYEWGAVRIQAPIQAESRGFLRMQACPP